ncbi:MAG TPA: CopG family antitoxin [Chloroflexota bacterium]|nr:CopG family antitoxin [Chloroflexota bacterium]
MTASQPRARPRGRSRIPEFTSVQEEAAWWDSHDAADYQDELRTVPVRAAKKLSEGITVRLDADSLAALRARARQTGVPPATLARQWLLECLRGGENHAPAANS